MMQVRWPLQGIIVAIAWAVVVAPSFAGPADDATLQTLPVIEPAIVQYRWTFVEPVWVVGSRRVDVRIIDPATRPRRIGYDMLEITMEHRRIGRVPEFSCKYADFALPNECHTTWRTVYADVPVPVVRRDYVEVDLPDWQWRDARTIVDMPRLEWQHRELVVSVPANAVYNTLPPIAPAATVKEMP
jgi:hypothetical protein